MHVNHGCITRTGYSAHSYESCSEAHEAQNKATVDTGSTRMILGLLLTEHARWSVPLASGETEFWYDFLF